LEWLVDPSLVDPPKEPWFLPSRSLIKATPGSEGGRRFTLFMGLAFMATGAFSVAGAKISAL